MTLAAVTEARNTADQFRKAVREPLADRTGITEISRAEDRFVTLTANLLTLSESYPDLQASESFILLQEELVSTKNRITYARQAYNDAVAKYNGLVQTVPSNLVALATRFDEAAMLEFADQAAIRQSPPETMTQNNDCVRFQPTSANGPPYDGAPRGGVRGQRDRDQRCDGRGSGRVIFLRSLTGSHGGIHAAHHDGNTLCRLTISSPASAATERNSRKCWAPERSIRIAEDCVQALTGRAGVMFITVPYAHERSPVDEDVRAPAVRCRRREVATMA